MTILNALDEIASIKEAEAKAYRNLVKVVAGVAENKRHSCNRGYCRR